MKLNTNFLIERDRTTNGEIGPVTDQIYEIWNCAIFVIFIIRGKSQLYIYTKHSLLAIKDEDYSLMFSLLL